MRGLYQPLKSQTLFIPYEGPNGHLFVVLTKTCPAGKNLLVPICTQRRNFDRTCLLGVGDHPFIRVASFVMYAHLKTYDAKVLIRHVEDKIISYRELMSEKLFALIGAGVEMSEYSPMNMQKYYRDHR